MSLHRRLKRRGPPPRTAANLKDLVVRYGQRFKEFFHAAREIEAYEDIIIVLDFRFGVEDRITFEAYARSKFNEVFPLALQEVLVEETPEGAFWIVVLGPGGGVFACQMHESAPEEMRAP